MSINTNQTSQNSVSSFFATKQELSALAVNPFTTILTGPLPANQAYTINKNNPYAILSILTCSAPFKNSYSAFLTAYSQFLVPPGWSFTWSGLTSPNRTYSIRGLTRWMGMRDDGSLYELLTNTAGIDNFPTGMNITTTTASSGTSTPGTLQFVGGNNFPGVIQSEVPITRIALVFSAMRTIATAAYTADPSQQVYTDDLFNFEPDATFTLTIQGQNVVLFSMTNPENRTLTSAQRNVGITYPPANNYRIAVFALN